MEKTATVTELLSWEPCWPRSKVLGLAAEYPREHWTAIDVLSLAELTPAEKLWVVLRPELLDDKTLRLFACECAETALMREREAGREPDKRSWDAVAVSRRFAAGEASAEELAAAWAAASEAARAETRAAAWEAEAAARAAASEAASAAAWATWTEARMAASEACRATSEVGRVRALRKLLEPAGQKKTEENFPKTP